MTPAERNVEPRGEDDENGDDEDKGELRRVVV